ncbi:protocatechuate 3,4-dioxygenase subunit alpha [Nocardioides sp.]|uniref:protocatechuate 3,4-dioxygenase subunit alpha n=1 Tax=Nocardioides sp. TaxID=35761 RepID=UPI0026245F96|nr:protocatechuate 3,4-dioxygenase subunit alpha [Nocardioides sp.]
MTATPTPIPTAGQTVGPFFHFALTYDGDSELVPRGAPGSVRLHGTVTDGAGEPVPDALLELWQADESGAVVQRAGSLGRDGWTFTGFGRSATDAEGRYSFTTLVPGEAAPFFAIAVFARGLTHRLFTRAYLPGASDALLERLDPARRATLLAAADADGLVFDVRLQGDGETVFLDFGDE